MNFTVDMTTSIWDGLSIEVERAGDERVSLQFNTYEGGYLEVIMAVESAEELLASLQDALMDGGKRAERDEMAARTRETVEKIRKLLDSLEGEELSE